MLSNPGRGTYPWRKKRVSADACPLGDDNASFGMHGARRRKYLMDGMKHALSEQSAAARSDSGQRTWRNRVMVHHRGR